MNRIFRFSKIFASVIIAATCALQASALKTSTFSKSSSLATGHWVKIKIAESGIYEITNQQLLEMGFSNPANVKVYGYGGVMLQEYLVDGNIVDDMKYYVNVGRTSDKIYFYAQGPVSFAYKSNVTPHFERTINYYSQYSYYFLSEVGSTRTVPSTGQSALSGTNVQTSSRNLIYHELEANNLTTYGNNLFGEPLVSGSTSLNFSLPRYVENSTITLQTSIAAVNSASTAITSSLAGNPVTFTESYTLDNRYDGVSYAIASPIATVDGISGSAENITYTAGVDNSASITSGYLDYTIIDYQQRNDFSNCENSQFRMRFHSLTTSDRIDVENLPADGEIWNVANRNTVKKFYTERTYNEETQRYTTSATPGITGSADFIAFSPSSQLMKVTDYEIIPNQNLHSITSTQVPNMVIITSAELFEQATRLAQFRKEHDGMDVLVVDHKQIFNEFSSGTPDATAYRHFLKMLYDRNSTKLTHLLLFGPGYFDNRQLTSKQSESCLLTYQGGSENNWQQAYVSDDYFTMLIDESGSVVTGSKPVLGVGRITAITADEAKTVVDKIIKYHNTFTYSDWTNTITLFSDYKADDKDEHLHRVVAVANTIETTLGNKQIFNKVFDDAFADKTTEKEKLIQSFQEGTQFFLYFGHGSTNSISQTSLWKKSDVTNYRFPRLPIMTIAACDIAVFDSGVRGFGEYMEIFDDRGGIVVLTATRTVDSYENYTFMNAFYKALFTLNADGTQPTLGEAYRNAKASLGNSRNKMCFSLFGDPSIRPVIAQPLAVVSEVDGTSTTAEEPITIKPSTKINVKGQINDRSDNLDSSFNGTATIYLYDKAPFFKDTQLVSSTATLPVYLERNLLAKVTAEIVNGQFASNVFVPANCSADGSDARILVFAQNEQNTKFANGDYTNLIIGEYDESVAITDTEAPVIQGFYLNDEEQFKASNIVSDQVTIHAIVSDDLAMSSPTNNIGQSARLILDGTTTLVGTDGFCSFGSEGKTLSISMPLSQLSNGDHTLQLSVSDASGNLATQTINFVVFAKDAESNVTLNASQSIAREPIEFTPSNWAEGTSFDVTILDASGNVVREAKGITTESWSWDLRDDKGADVAPAIYYYYATIHKGGRHYGTEILHLAVVAQ